MTEPEVLYIINNRGGKTGGPGLPASLSPRTSERGDPHVRKLIAILAMIATLLPFASCGTENVLTLHVAAGAAGGDGSEEAPFGSLNEARLAIRARGK